MSDWWRLSTADKVELLKQQVDVVKYHLEKLRNASVTEQYRVSKELEVHSEELSRSLMRVCVDIQED